MYAPSLRLHRGFTTTMFAVVAASMAFGACANLDPEEEARRAMEKMKDRIGAFDFDLRMDLSALGQEGVTVNIKGVSRSQAVLSGTGVISVAETDGSQSVAYSGYRSDTREYYSINLDPSQTALGYMSGRFAKPGVLKMSDPAGGITLEAVSGEGGNSRTTIRIPPDQAVLMEIDADRTADSGGDVLDSLLNAPIEPARVNRSSDSPNPAENYARSHEFLRQFAGDFTDSTGKIIRSRMVGDGRYVITHSHGPEEAISFMAWNNAGRYFQQITILPDLPMPIYLQGEMLPDGTVSMSDPFNPQGLKVMIKVADDGGYTTVTSMGPRELERRTWSRK